MGFARIFERMLDFFDCLIDELKWPKKVREFSLVLLFYWQSNTLLQHRPETGRFKMCILGKCIGNF
jgi:hypothetical protein